jgi:hypothetical protein
VRPTRSPQSVLDTVGVACNAENPISVLRHGGCFDCEILGGKLSLRQ